MIAENLRLETRGTGIRVTDIRPGRVTSEFYDVALPEEAAARVKDTKIRELSPEDIAAAILYAVTVPPAEGDTLPVEAAETQGSLEEVSRERSRRMAERALRDAAQAEIDEFLKGE